MSKNFVSKAEGNSIFLVSPTDSKNDNKLGARSHTIPLRSARTIPIDRIKPDPSQPRKTFNQNTLESLAESIKELGGIIDPLTVEYIEGSDNFNILSGERRYRAAKIIGLTELPCIVKEVDDNNRYLLQLILNLQREDIPSLEEAAGIKHLIQQHGLTQLKVAQLLNKSKSYVCQILGLDRLSEKAKEKVQTSELPREIQIKASREKEPEKQLEILKKASDDGKTVRQIRKEQAESKLKNSQSNKIFKVWEWDPPDGSFSIKIKFNQEKLFKNKTEILKSALKTTLGHIGSNNDM